MMELSVVIPVFNEATALPELTRRARSAARSCDPHAEVILVDDASRDATRSLADALTDETVRFVHLTHNQGQTSATLEGIACARGRVIVVLDGDLQDPPEHITALYTALATTPHAAVAYAVKRDRHESVGARTAFALYHTLQRAFAAVPMPTGAGSFCAFRAELREVLLARQRSRANVAALLALGHAPFVAVPYVKARRADGDSRVGAWGLCHEALDSLAATGALRRAAMVTAAGVALGAAAFAPHPLRLSTATVGASVGALAVAFAIARGRRVASSR